MASNDDPFGRKDKTVIRPRPGGSFSTGPTAASPFDAPFGAPPPRPQTSQQPGQQSGQQPGVTGPQDWMLGQRLSPDAAPVAPSRRVSLQAAIAARTGEDIKSANRITQAASPLLILLGRLRQQIVEVEARPLLQHAGLEITRFEKTLLSGAIPEEQVRIAKYALCATADDIVQNLPGQDIYIWQQHSMVAHYFGDRNSGVDFFDQVRRLMASPSVYRELLELIHACLSLGFQGVYRSANGGDNELQRVRRDVYLTLQNVKPEASADLSPRWRGLERTLRRFHEGVPLWAVGAIAAAILVILFFALRYLLDIGTADASERLAAMHPSTPVEIQSVAVATPQTPQPPPVKMVSPQVRTQIERIKASMPNEIASGIIAVEPVGDRIVIRVSNLLLFASGNADLKSEFANLADRLGTTLNREKGPIFVIGHTDSTKLSSTSRFKSNYDLSVKRAQAVADALAPRFSDASRIKVSGKGDKEPVADNKTAQGREQNRRVEISIMREESL